MSAPTTTYYITGDTLHGVWVFSYHLHQYLAGFQVKDGVMSEAQCHWLFEKHGFPYKESMIKQFDGVKNITVNKELPDITFDAFWNSYKLKRNKMDAQKVWKKLNDNDKVQAILGIRRYDGWLRQQNGIAKKLADTYLKKRTWEDDL